MNDLSNLEVMVDQVLDSKTTTHGLARALRLLKKELRLFDNHTKNVLRHKDAVLNKGTQKVQIGGGTHILDGFLNIDIVPPADIITDVREEIPLPSGLTQFIFSEHFFEHVDYPRSAKIFITECHRILADGGEMVLGVPDTELAANAYVTRDATYYKTIVDTWYKKRNCVKDINTYIDILNYVIRDQDDDEKYNPHFWGYDYDKLESLCLTAGFSHVEKWEFNESIANPKRKWGSVYIKATK